MSLWPSTRHSDDASVRRWFDVCCALLALGIVWPIMIVVAAAIWIETGRPILFSQRRIGRKGQPFEMYKFRKFGPHCGVDGSPLTVAGDKRMTTVGRVLLVTKLDELPQFFNVLRGDMSIVGPRPESLHFEKCFEGGFEEILAHKPGIFGPCQVIFRHEGRLYPHDCDAVEFYRQVLFPAKARIDLSYYRRRTFWSDLRWIGRAFLVICGVNWQRNPQVGQRPLISTADEVRP